MCLIMILCYPSVKRYDDFKCCFSTNNNIHPCADVIHFCNSIVSSGKRPNNISLSSSSSSSSTIGAIYYRGKKKLQYSYKKKNKQTKTHVDLDLLQ